MTSDPVHFADSPSDNADGYTSPGWYFWDESETHRYGPYSDEEKAQEQCAAYHRWIDSECRE
jgi:hypothetical protein